MAKNFILSVTSLKIGIVGYWATSISMVSATVLSKNVINGFISGFGHYFPDFG